MITTSRQQQQQQQQLRSLSLLIYFLSSRLILVMLPTTLRKTLLRECFRSLLLTFKKIASSSFRVLILPTFIVSNIFSGLLHYLQVSGTCIKLTQCRFLKAYVTHNIKQVLLSIFPHCNISLPLWYLTKEILKAHL